MTYQYKFTTEDGTTVAVELKDYAEVPGRVSLDHIGDTEAQVWASFKWGLVEPANWPPETKGPGWALLRVVPMSKIMQMYNDWQTDAKITAPESEASSS